MIKKFENFNINNKILYAFDLDDTLIKSKKFGDEIYKILNENKSLKDLLYSEINKIGIKLSDLNYENGKIYFLDKDRKIDLSNNILWNRRNSRIYLKAPEDFFIYDNGKPTEINEKILKIYKKSKNKSIITIRKEIFKNYTINLMNELNIEYPNNGLFMYPYSIIKNRSEWKSSILLNLYKNYNEINYFDDDIKLLRSMRKYMLNENIKLYHVNNNNYRLVN